MDVIFLIYGAAFFAMALIIIARRNPESALTLSAPLWLLAAFGLSHGALEWTDLWKVIHGGNALLNFLQPLLLAISYLYLFEFGRRVVLLSLPPTAASWRPLLQPRIYILLLGPLLLALLLAEQPMATLGIFSRYFVGFTGSTLTGCGLILYAQGHLLKSLNVEEKNN